MLAADVISRHFPEKNIDRIRVKSGTAFSCPAVNVNILSLYICRKYTATRELQEI